MFKEELAFLLHSLSLLLKVKTLVTLGIVSLFIYLSINDKITPDNVMIIVTSVVSFYFGTQHERQTNLTSNYLNLKDGK